MEDGLPLQLPAGGWNPSFVVRAHTSWPQLPKTKGQFQPLFLRKVSLSDLRERSKAGASHFHPALCLLPGSSLTETAMETPGPESLSFRSWVRSRSPHQMSLIRALIYGILSQILRMATLYLGTFPHWVGLLMSYCRFGNTIHYCWSYNLCWGGKSPPSPRHGETKRKVIWWPADLTSFSSLLSFGQKTYQFPCQHRLTCSISTEGRKAHVGSKWMRTWKALLTNVPAH